LLSNKIYPYEMSKMVTRHVNEFIKNDLYQSIYFILFYVLALRYNLMFFELFYPFDSVLKNNLYYIIFP